MTYRERKKLRRAKRSGRAENIDPMNYVSNLADVMLILAVGIMLALVLHWNVPVGNQADDGSDAEQDAITFSQDDLNDEQEIPDDLTQVGDVYYDAESGTYYIVQRVEGAGND